jgi:hypothetical protein
MRETLYYILGLTIVALGLVLVAIFLVVDHIMVSPVLRIGRRHLWTANRFLSSL